MRNNVMMKIATVLLVAVLITTCSVSGTFAKYTSAATGFASARVARWAFTVGETNITTSNTLTFNLFSTAYDTNGGTATNDADVADGSTNAVIAPGTWGYFVIQLSNVSEVSAKYTIDFEQVKNNAASGLNLKFYKGAASNTLPTSSIGWTDNINNWNIQDTNIAIGASDSICLFWKWDYENGQDSAETALGVNAAGANPPSITVTATITATQVD